MGVERQANIRAHTCIRAHTFRKAIRCVPGLKILLFVLKIHQGMVIACTKVEVSSYCGVCAIEVLLMQLSPILLKKLHDLTLMGCLF